MLCLSLSECFDSIVFLNDTATTDIYTYLHPLSLHVALPIWPGVDPDRVVRALTRRQRRGGAGERGRTRAAVVLLAALPAGRRLHRRGRGHRVALDYQCRLRRRDGAAVGQGDRKSTRLNSSH